MPQSPIHDEAALEQRVRRLERTNRVLVVALTVAVFVPVLGAAQFAHGGGGYALHGPDGR